MLTIHVDLLQEAFYVTQIDPYLVSWTGLLGHKFQIIIPLRRRYMSHEMLQPMLLEYWGDW